MGDRSRLPKWAQEELARLESNVEHLKARATAGPENSDTFLWHSGGDDKPLGQGERIRFLFPEHDEGPRWRDYIDARMTERGELEIMGGQCISVRPQSGNVIAVKVVDY